MSDIISFSDAPNDTFEIDNYLEVLNEEFASSISPAIVFICCLMLVGLLGNSYVLYVYSKKNCNRTIIKFIQALAVFDLLSCAIAMPGEIWDMSQNYTFGDSGWCPTFRTVNLFCTMASGTTLVVVAADRYRRICFPLDAQIRPRTASLMLLSVSVVCMVLALPSAAVFGPKSVPTPLASINGSDCSISDRIADTPIPLIFNGFQLLIFLIGAVVLVIIYSLIARTICLQARQRKKRGRNRRLHSLKNGGLISPTFSRPDVSSPSSPCPGNKQRTAFNFPESMKDNVIDFSDAEREALNEDDEEAQGVDNNNVKIFEVDETAEDLLEKPRQRQHHHQRQQRNGLKIQLSPNVGGKTNKANLFMRSVSVSSSTSGIDTDPASNTTTSPPDTPIDILRLDCVSLIKPSRSWKEPHNQSIEKLRVHQGHAKKRPSSIPKNYRLGENKHDTEGDKHGGNSTTEDSKPFPTIGFEVNISSNIDNDKVNLNSEVTTEDGVSNGVCGKVVYRDKRDDGNVCGHSKVTSESSKKGHRMSLVLPPHDKKILFRSSSLGREDSYRSGRHCSLKRESKSPTSAFLKTSHKLARISSVRGIRDLRKLTLSEYYQGTVRTTLMLFVITVVYILSFLPHLVLMTFKAVGHESEDGTWEVAKNTLVRSYFINSVANPIIYSFCSRNFFSQCRNAPSHHGTLTR